ncbi:blastula protease 10-like [Lineus longissimus]|uniref:blastula protease 10-like n=1 Tax=Lineus longissimus TaxID=88925 RepID=UPI00315D1E59
MSKLEERQFMLTCIELYRELPALWKVKSKEYSDRNKKDAAYQTLLEKYRERYPKASRDDLTKKLNSLRTNYRKELNKYISLARRRISLWDKAIVTYVFDEGEEDAAYKESDVARIRIRTMMSYYEDRTCVKFVPWTSGSKDEYDLGHNNRLIFGDYGGCSSLVGNVGKTDEGRENKISTCSGSKARHEIGHALGLMHEQCRQDRDKTIRFFEHNLGDGSISSYKKKSYEMSVPYDLSSVLQYNFMRKGLPVLLPHDTEDIPLKDLGKGFYGASFYDIKAINLNYNCKENMCSDSTLECENDGYLAYVEQQCRCLCPNGLGGERCQKIYKPSGDSPVDWPEGDFAVLAPSCPEGFTEVDHDFFKIFKNKELANKYTYCEKKSSSKRGMNTWPTGQYCLFKVGDCPSGFSAGSVNYISKKKKKGPSVSIGFCCRHDRNVDTAISLPRKTSFYMFPSYAVDGAEWFNCQKVEGMRATLETTAINWNPSSILEIPYGLMKSQGKFEQKMSLCRYDPVNYDCGGVVNLVEGARAIDFTTEGMSETQANECTWLFEGPQNSFLQLDLSEFNLLPESNGECKDALEVRKHLFGQRGVRYCGNSLAGRVIVTQHNHLILTMTTNLPNDMKSQGFKAKVQVIRAADMCYNVTNNGATYAGDVNYTQKNDPCIPWEEVPTSCFDEETNLQENMKGNNYCRNPNGLTKPWCFKKMDCQQDMCDVCHLETRKEATK